MLAYPDRPFGFGNLIGREFNPETQRREPFLIAATRDLDESIVYAKERRLVEEVKASLDRGRRVQVYAVYTQKRDVTRRLERILAKEGIRVAVLTTEVAPELREAWYERQLRAGVQVVIGHPRLVQTGLDLWSFPDIFFYETAIPSTRCVGPAGDRGGSGSGTASTSSSSTTPGPCRRRASV